MKKLVITGVMVLGLIISLFVPAMAQEKEPIVFGGSLALTGIFAEPGKWVQRGYEYWAEEINAKGGLLGRPVKLIIYDDESSAEKAITLFEKAITVDKVDFLIGAFPGTSAAAVMPVAEKYKKVFNSVGGHMISFSQGLKYVFGGPPYMGQWWTTGLWQYIETLPANQRPKRVAILTMNNVIGLSAREQMVEEAKRLGMRIVVDDKYNLPLTTADALVTKAKQSQADLLFANGFFDDGAMTVRAAKTIKYNPKYIFQTVGCTLPAWVDQLKEDGDYAFSGTVWHARLPFPGSSLLHEVVLKRWNITETPIYFGSGYCWLQVLQRGIEGTKSLDQEKIRDYLKSNEIKTVAGNFHFDQRGLPKPYQYLTQVQKGKLELVWPPEVQTARPIAPKPAWK
jgi:branched-chain amino acid transport system substrate-binding protein